MADQPQAVRVAEGLSREERLSIARCAQHVHRAITLDVELHKAVSGLLAHAARAEGDALATSKIAYAIDVAARIDERTRGIMDGIGDAADQLLNTQRLTNLIAALTEKETDSDERDQPGS